MRLATGDTTPPPAHPRLWRAPGVTAARTGRSGVICLDGPTADLPTLLDACAWLRGTGSGDVLVWSATPRPDLDLPLLAHGFDLSFQPRWMARALPAYLPRLVEEPGVDIHLARLHDFHALRATDAIPYVSADQFPAMQALVRAPVRIRRVWMLVARKGGVAHHPEVLGQAVVNISDGPDGRFAGLFNLGVHAEHRKQGIGTALTIAACNLARDLRATHIGLNATPAGLPIYRSMGFEDAGAGQTWFLAGRRLATPPDPETVRFALATAEGTLPALAPAALPRHLANGETPLTFAARFDRADSVRWLFAHGAPAEILPLWTVGLRGEALALMHDPAAVSARIAPQGTTPLHEAVQRDDRALAKHLIFAGADLSLTDDRYRATPLDWARALDHDEIAAMIEVATAGDTPSAHAR
jgi:GNAT superfamily N-acetyltransferase